MSRITIENFEGQLPQSTVAKGKKYIESGAVNELISISAGEWQVYVEGTEVYAVRIQLKGISIVKTTCDCRQSGYCEHVIAALFAIRGDLSSDRDTEKTLQADTNPYSALLKKIKLTEIKAFLEEYGRKNKEFRTLFLLHFSDQLKESGKEKYETLIRNIVKAATSHDGMIHHHAVQIMSLQLQSLLDEATQQLAKRNYLDPFNLAQILITEISPLLSFVEDTDHTLPVLIESSLILLENILESDAAYELKEDIFEFTLRESMNIKADFHESWFQLLTTAASDDPRKEKALQAIEQRIISAQLQQSEAGSDGMIERLLRNKMQMLTVMGRKEEAHKVMEDNLRIRSFRIQLIEESIARKDFENAKEIIKNSKLGDQQKGRLYESVEWDKLLLRIAIEEQDVSVIRNVSLNLFRNTQDMSYYRMVKSTYAEDEWSPQRESIITSIRTSPYFSFPGIKSVAEILKEEKEWPRLLQLLEKNASLNFVEEYFPFIKDHYPEEVVAIYKEALRRYAEQKMGREHYRRVAETLVKMQSLPTGKDVAKALAIEFKVKYRQRKNMVNELNKLVF